MVGHLGDHHAAVGVADQSDRGIHVVEDPTHAGGVGSQIAESGRVGAGAGQPVDDHRAMPRALHAPGHLLPPRPVTERSVDENERGHDTDRNPEPGAEPPSRGGA